MMQREIFQPEHELFRETVRRFLQAEVAPQIEHWEARGGFEHGFFEAAGAAGLLCPTVPEALGGPGADLLYSAVLLEEAAPYSNFGLSLTMHSEIVTNYLLHFAGEHLQKRWLPRMVTGEVIGALAMTEPGAGSDVKAVRTAAVREGDGFVLNGSKTFISNATVCDLVIVVAKTDPAAGAKGTSLLAGRHPLAWRAQGPAAQEDGPEVAGHGRAVLRERARAGRRPAGRGEPGLRLPHGELPWERLQIAISAIAAAEAAYRWTVDYVRERKAFGQAVADFQNTRFVLAELKTEMQIGRLRRPLPGAAAARHAGPQAASMAKYWTTDLQGKVVDACVQLHGGYGFMAEYPIARAYVDARAQRIYGGTNEIMKELIARDL
jgi:alkylation response protein AidB-like acyl-CoA dehydrogenase